MKEAPPAHHWALVMAKKGARVCVRCVGYVRDRGWARVEEERRR
jgi:hypothetical protein